jgi:hypothetical protein
MPVVPTAIIAFILLALLDGFIIMVSLLGDSGLQLLLMVLCLVTTALAFVAKRPLLIFVSQTLVTGLIVLRCVQSLQSGTWVAANNGVISVIAPIVIVTLGYALAWLVARAVPSER